MFKWLKTLRKKSKELGFKFKEDVDFRIVPDLDAAKRNDPHPWNIYFLGRMFKVHYIRIPSTADYDGNLHIDISAEVLYGEPFTDEENQLVGKLLMELIQRNMIERD